MEPGAHSPISIDTLARSTSHYSSWLEGASATPKQIGVHGFRFDAHEQPERVWLDSFHAILCLRGQASIRRTMGGALEQFDLGPGEVLVNPMATPLRWAWSGGVEVMNITVHPGYLDEVVRESMGGLVRLRPRALPHAPDRTLSDFALELLGEMRTPGLVGAQRGARAIGERIAIHLLRRYVDLEPNGRGRAFSQEERSVLLGYVSERLDQPISVGRLASLVGLGEHHFTRTFRATFGQAPHAWLRERRLERARELLISTEESIASIANATGFADQSHLTRTFGATFGTTPAALRRRDR